MQLSLVEIAVTGSTVEVILPPGPEDALEHLADRGRIDEDERLAGQRFLQLRRAVIGREHVRATKLGPRASRSADPVSASGELHWAYEQAALALHDAGASARAATLRLLVDNQLPRTELELADACLGLGALAYHFAELDQRKQRRR